MPEAALTIIALLFESEHLIRSIVIDGETWFVGIDVCRTLGIRDHHQALGRLDSDERGRYGIPTPSGIQEHIIISEAGVYRLIFRSTKPVAERFKRWLAHDVIPEIRRTGSYMGFGRQAADPAIINDALKLAKVREARHVYGSRAAAELWKKLGLEVTPSMRHGSGQGDLFADTPTAKD
jgi:prophage antirepressor-like protein